MSSIKVTNLLQASSSTNNMVLTSGGDVQVTNKLQFNSGYGSVATAYGCRAWVNFDGTTASPSTIRGSGNVSSVTKDGTGRYTVNFTTAMPDANYAVGFAGSKYDTTDDANIIGGIRTSSVTPMQTGSVKIATGATSSQPADVPFVCVSIFR